MPLSPTALSDKIIVITIAHMHVHIMISNVTLKYFDEP